MKLEIINELEQSIYIWNTIKQINIDNWIIILENTTSGKLNTEIIFLSESADDESDHNYYCDYSHIEPHIKDLIWKILSKLIVRRVKDWFVLIFRLKIENEMQDIKVYIPAYSQLGTYYSDNMNLAIYRNRKLIIESLAENNWGYYSFNKDLQDF